MTSNYQFHHSCPLQLRFNDIDTLGHATNSVYQQYFDLGRMEYFADVLQEQMDWQDEGLILVSININYLAPVKLYDEIEVRTKIVKLGNKSLEMLQQVYNKTNQTLAAESRSIMVGFSVKNEQSIPVAERWRKRIIEFEKDIDFGL